MIWIFWGARGELNLVCSVAAVVIKWSLYREDEADLREIINHEEILPLFGWWGSKEQPGMGTWIHPLNAF
ncbi:MAG: hypothetical protein ACKVHR_04300 [Pirellulales bacterium]|jgi:hypothetical protein